MCSLWKITKFLPAIKVPFLNGPGTASHSVLLGLTLAVGTGIAAGRGQSGRPAVPADTLPRPLAGTAPLGVEEYEAAWTAAGAEVDAVPVYRTLPADADAEALRARLVAGEIDVLSFTSPSTVRNFVALLDAPARAAAERAVVAAIGPVTAQALRKEGLEPDVVPARASAADLVEALVRSLAGRREEGGA